ncbi:MAG: hypothetical protein IT463_06210 [Planctomycetes bacterium]|nr:hypothetical protein [Planctomycetota bacterium]
MAKKPVAKRAAGAAAGAAPPPNEAAVQFDKFGTFALALPSTLLAIVVMVLGIGYTNDRFDVGFFGIPGKKIASWDSLQEAVPAGSAKINGFESHNYIGRLNDGDVDVVVISAGYEQNVNMGDVFTLKTEVPDVRLEFVVFDVQATVCRAYILLGQNVSEGKERQHSLKADAIQKLCGENAEVQRLWKDQIMRRYVEARSNQQ